MRLPPRPGRTSALVRAVASLLLCGALAGCSGGSEEPGDDDPSGSAEATPTESASPTDLLPVPEGVELTPQGSALEVGDTATVAYQVRQGVVGVLDVTVTRLEKTSFADSFEGWDLSAETKKAKPYFVRATLVNQGTTDLGGRPVPLYIVDATNTLVEATSFASQFRPCEPGRFPEEFPAGASTKVCLVYLAPDKGDLTAVSFRPTQEDDPITWTGELKNPKPPKKPGKGKNQDENEDEQPDQ